MKKYEIALERIISGEPFSKQYIKDRELLEVLFERAEPKITIKKNILGSERNICPSCDYVVYENFDFCHKCGQALERR